VGRWFEPSSRIEVILDRARQRRAFTQAEKFGALLV